MMNVLVLLLKVFFEQSIYSFIIYCILFLDILKGINGTILAYGQTSSGKTFTMMV